MFKIRIFRPKTMEVNIEKLPKFIVEKFEREKKEIETKFLPRTKEIYSALEQIRARAVMMKAKSSGDSYANTVKNRFCEKAVSSIDTAGLPGNSFESIDKFMSSASVVIKSIGSLNMKEFRHLGAFRDDMSFIASRIRLIEDEINDFNRAVSGSLLLRAVEIRDSIERIKKWRAMMEEMKKKHDMLEKSALDIESALLECRKTLEACNLRLSEYSIRREKIYETETMMKNIKQRIESEFSGLDRVFKKFLYFGDISKKEGEILKIYIDNPAEAFIEGDCDMLIKTILQKIYEFRNRQLIDLDSKRLEKIKDLMQIHELLLDLKDQYKYLKSLEEKQTAEFESGMQPIVMEAKEHALSLDTKKKELEKTRSEMSSLIDKIRKLESEEAATRNKIETEASALLGRAVRLV